MAHSVPGCFPNGTGNRSRDDGDIASVVIAHGKKACGVRTNFIRDSVGAEFVARNGDPETECADNDAFCCRSDLTPRHGKAGSVARTFNPDTRRRRVTHPASVE